MDALVRSELAFRGWPALEQLDPYRQVALRLAGGLPTLTSGSPMGQGNPTNGLVSGR